MISIFLYIDICAWFGHCTCCTRLYLESMWTCRHCAMAFTVLKHLGIGFFMCLVEFYGNWLQRNIWIFFIVLIYCTLSILLPHWFYFGNSCWNPVDFCHNQQSVSIVMKLIWWLGKTLHCASLICSVNDNHSKAKVPILSSSVGTGADLRLLRRAAMQAAYAINLEWFVSLMSRPTFTFAA